MLKRGVFSSFCKLSRRHGCSTQQYSRETTQAYPVIQDRRFVPRGSEYDNEQLNRLLKFVASAKRLFVLTGAGVSTESGIRDYRSENVGLYAVSDERPIQYQDFLNNPVRRHRYWARNFLGWEFFSSKRPNKGHVALSKMEHTGKVHWLVTQNVDGLHLKANSRKVTELHGTASRVACLNCKAEVSRQSLQDKLEHLNPDLNVKPGMHGPDGDIVVPDNMIEDFQMVSCEVCGGVLKPKIVFFGEDIPKQVKAFAHKRLEECDALLVAGSSLTVFSSYRMTLQADKLGIPIAILNIGKTRGDHLASLRVTGECGEILDKLVSQNL